MVLQILSTLVSLNFIYLHLELIEATVLCLGSTSLQGSLEHASGQKALAVVGLTMYFPFLRDLNPGLPLMFSV